MKKGAEFLGEVCAWSISTHTAATWRISPDGSGFLEHIMSNNLFSTITLNILYILSFFKGCWLVRSFYYRCSWLGGHLQKEVACFIVCHDWPCQYFHCSQMALSLNLLRVIDQTFKGIMSSVICIILNKTLQLMLSVLFSVGTLEQVFWYLMI